MRCIRFDCCAREKWLIVGLSDVNGFYFVFVEINFQHTLYVEHFQLWCRCVHTHGNGSLSVCVCVCVCGGCVLSEFWLNSTNDQLVQISILRFIILQLIYVE